MLPKNAQYGILAIGGVTAIVILAISFWPDRVPDPPEVLQQRILGGESVETRSQAARDMIYHGERARGTVGESLQQYRGGEPEVVVPLIQATQKAKDSRSLPRLFELMEDPDPRIRGKAAAAVRKIMGSDYFFRANDPPEQRAETLRAIRHTYEQFGADLEKYHPYEE